MATKPPTKINSALKAEGLYHTIIIIIMIIMIIIIIMVMIIKMYAISESFFYVV